MTTKTAAIMAEIEARLQALHKRISALGVLKQQPVLIAVSKFQAFEKIESAFHLGLSNFGENYLQEALLKIQKAKEKHLKITWHFIGKIQSNKTRAIAENFDWTHTIERLKIAERLNAQRPKDLPPLNICVEINLGEENNKSGVLIKDAEKLCLSILKLKHLKLRGLMAIPPATENKEKQRFYAKTLADCLKNIKSVLPKNAQDDFNVLSIGMSDDLESSLLEGATHIRIGTAIFGERVQKTP